MASNISICGLCDLRHLSNPSTHWCQDCDEALCSECQEHHTLLKATRGHTTIPINDYEKLPAFITDIKQYCDTHNEKFQNYCQKHECPICYKCIQDHAKCTENILPLETVIEHSKTSQIFQELNQSVSDLQSNITQMRIAREDNLAKLADQCKSAIKKIREYRIKVNHHLDAVEKGLITKLQDAENKCSQQIEEVIKSLNEVELEISNFDNILQGMKQHASDFQVYLATREIEQQVSDKEKRLTSMMENKRFDNLTVSLEIKNILSDVKMFGTVSVETIPTNDKLINRKSRKAQILTNVFVKSIDDIKFRQIIKFESLSKGVTGCTILPDRRNVFTQYDGNHRLLVRKVDENHDLEIPLNIKSFDVTVVDVAVVAVSSGWVDSGNKACILIINMNSLKITKMILSSSKCFGLLCVEENLIFCGYKPNGIYKICLKTNEKSVISSTIPLDLWSYITHFNNKFYVTNDNTHTVTCFDHLGNVIWTYTDRTHISLPRGITVDNNGNVFVASLETSSVTVISPDGSRAKQILGITDGLDRPCALHYDRSADQLLVSNYQGPAYLFDAH